MILLWVLLLAYISKVQTITCSVGYGQRGLEYSNQLLWTRQCPTVGYCFEVVTTDITVVQTLIDYPWNDYYAEYFIRSCGGDFGTPQDYHPYKGFERSIRALGRVTINITVPYVITGQGGSAVMNLHYSCRKNLCTSGPSASAFLALHTSYSWVLSIVSIFLLTVWMSRQS